MGVKRSSSAIGYSCEGNIHNGLLQRKRSPAGRRAVSVRLPCKERVSEANDEHHSDDRNNDKSNNADGIKEPAVFFLYEFHMVSSRYDVKLRRYIR